MFNKLFRKEDKKQEMPVVSKEDSKIEKADKVTNITVGGIGIVLSMFICSCAAPFFTTTMVVEAVKEPQVKVVNNVDKVEYNAPAVNTANKGQNREMAMN